MTTSIFLALATAVLPGFNVAPIWQTSYADAQQSQAAQRKPLVVVFGSGSNGWTKVMRAERPTPEVAKLLADNYVCLYIDTATSSGKKLAQDFEITSGLGFVISDRQGKSQAFWHQGDMTSDSLASYLKHYADPTVVIRGTETVNTSRTSYYPANSQPQSSRTITTTRNC